VAAAHRRYAQALYEAALDNGRLAQVREGLLDIVAAHEEVPELAAVLRNPQLDSRAKIAVVEDVAAGSDRLVRNALLLLVEKGRAGEIEEVVREFEALVRNAERRLEVELTTAVPLSEEDAARLVGDIERAVGRPVDAQRRVDPSVVGGVVLQVGSLRLDASVRGRIDRLRRELASAG
jgi:F-type H+-transporting ATPase subunit delta